MRERQQKAPPHQPRLEQREREVPAAAAPAQSQDAGMDLMHCHAGGRYM